MADRPTIRIAAPSIRSGDVCRECSGGHLTVYAGRDCGSVRVKYLHCDKCKAKPSPNTIYVPVEFIARRRKKL